MRPGVEKLVLCKQTTTQSQRLNIHINAGLTLRSRAALVAAIQDKSLTLKAAAAALSVRERTVRKVVWVLPE
jgi:hypothetical protein